MHDRGMEEEVSLALIGILVVGTVAMVGLVSCYICVLRDLCCRPASKRGRHGSNPMQDDFQMGDTTQNVEISMGTDTDHSKN